MLCDLFTTYVEAVNKGAVPNIQHAWTYICKNECEKAISEAVSSFEEQIREEFESSFPLTEPELMELYKTCEREAYDVFKSKAIGDSKEEFYPALDAKFGEIYE